MVHTACLGNFFLRQLSVGESQHIDFSWSVTHMMSSMWPGGECFAPPPSRRGSAPSILDFIARRREHPEHLTIWENHGKSWELMFPKMVRSILLQVTRGRQIAQCPILHSGFRTPFWSTISLAQVHWMKNSRYGLSWFFFSIFDFFVIDWVEMDKANAFADVHLMRFRYDRVRVVWHDDGYRFRLFHRAAWSGSSKASSTSNPKEDPTREGRGRERSNTRREGKRQITRKIN